MPITTESGRRVILIGPGCARRPGIIAALDADGVPLIRFDGLRHNIRIDPKRLPSNKRLHLLDQVEPVPALPMGRFRPDTHTVKAETYDGVLVIELDGDQVIAITEDINHALRVIASYGRDQAWARIAITADRLRSEWVAFEWQPEGSECEWLIVDAEPGDDMAVHVYRLPY